MGLAESPSFDAIGKRIEGHGRTVVLLHSSMSSKSQWRALAERLLGSHRLIAIDLHGYGDTPMPTAPERFGLDDELALVETVLAHALRAGERFHLVGHSFGGVVAMRVAQAHAVRVLGLTLIEPVAFTLLPTQDAGHAEIDAVRRAVAACVASGDLRGGTERFIDYWGTPGSFAQMPAQRQHALAMLLPKTALDFQAIVRAPMDARACRRIGVPVNLLRGQTSPLSTRRVIEVLRGLLPRSRHHEIGGAGHMAPITHPSLVNPLIEDFIHGIDAATR